MFQAPAVIAVGPGVRRLRQVIGCRQQRLFAERCRRQWRSGAVTGRRRRS
jgi:hypothetical protein